MSGINLTRRDLLAASSAVGLSASLEVTPFAARAAGKRVLRLANSTIGVADPHLPVDYPGSILMFNLYDFLVRPMPGGQLKPSVAKSWTISPDATVYTFDIQDGITFHNGKPLTAKDVAFSANRMITMKRGFAFLFDQVKTVEQTGPMTVAFTLKIPFAPFLASLVRLAIVSSDTVMANKKDGTFGEFGDYGQAYLSTTDAGSGPYTIVKHNAQQETVMRLIPTYWGGLAENPPEEVHSLFAIEQATVRAMMARKELELTRLPLSPEVLTALSKSPGVKLGQDRAPQIFQFKLNTQKPPMDDVNFRKALALAFDYDAVLALLDVNGVKSGQAARGPIPEGILGFDPTWPPPKRDLQAAKAALAKSKYGANPPAIDAIDYVYMQEVAIEEKMGLLFQQNMAEIGIKVNIVPTPWAQITQLATSPATTPLVSCVAVGVSTPDIDSLFWPEYHTTNSGTYISMEWLENKDVDAKLEKGRVLTDPKERELLYRDLAHEIADLYPTINCFQNFTLVAIQDYLTAPGLQDPAKSIPVIAGNYQFGQMSMKV